MIPEKAYIIGAAHVFCRTLGFFAVLPLQGASNGIVLKVSVALVSALSFATWSPGLNTSAFSFTGDLFVGLILGLPFGLFITGLKFWGELCDSGRGQTIATMYNPAAGGPSSQLGAVLAPFGWAVLLMSGLLVKGLGQIATSFGPADPVNLFFKEEWLMLAGKLMLMIAAAVNTVLFAYLPIAAIFFVLDCAMGFLSKAMPQAQLYSEMYQVKTYSFMILLMALGSRGSISWISGLFEQVMLGG